MALTPSFLSAAALSVLDVSAGAATAFVCWAKEAAIALWRDKSTMKKVKGLVIIVIIWIARSAGTYPGRCHASGWTGEGKISFLWGLREMVHSNSRSEMRKDWRCGAVRHTALTSALV